MRNERFDIVIIGTGAGGGTLAHALADTDARILLIERGGFVPQEPENADPVAVWKQLRYQTSERWLDDRGHLFRPYTHYCVGGNTKFWGSVLYRLRREDFQEVEHMDEADQGSYLRILGLLRNKPHGEELPVVILHPHEWEGRVVVWLDKDGKAGLFDEAGTPKPEIKKLVDAGISVVGVDLLYQGEFLADGKPLEQTGSVANPREAAAYTFGYNHSVFAKRVHDVLSVLSFVKHHELQPKQIDLVGLAGAGHWAAAAAAQSRGLLHAAAIDTQGFRFGNVLDIHSPDFLPGGAKYGDLPGMIEAAAVENVWVAEESGGRDATDPKTVEDWLLSL